MSNVTVGAITALWENEKSAEHRALQQCRAIIATSKDGVPDEFWSGLHKCLTNYFAARTAREAHYAQEREGKKGAAP